MIVTGFSLHPTLALAFLILYIRANSSEHREIKYLLADLKIKIVSIFY